MRKSLGPKEAIKTATLGRGRDNAAGVRGCMLVVPSQRKHGCLIFGMSFIRMNQTRLPNSQCWPLRIPAVKQRALYGPVLCYLARLIAGG